MQEAQFVYGTEWKGESMAFEKGIQLVFRDTREHREKKKRKYCVCGSFKSGFEGGHMGSTRQTIFFTGNGLSKGILAIDGVLFCRGPV